MKTKTDKDLDKLAVFKAYIELAKLNDQARAIQVKKDALKQEIAKAFRGNQRRIIHPNGEYELVRESVTVPEFLNPGYTNYSYDLEARSK